MVDLKIKLPDSFFEPEERYGYVTNREMKELWAVELDLLCEFDRVCKKLGIQYFLDGGTLLGAVRDGRFIPWDDDIDTIMLREDYDKLKKYGPAEFQEPYFLQNAYTDVDYRRGMCQLRRSDTTFILKREIEKHLPFNQGICIDIFCLDGIPPENEIDSFFEEKQALRKRIGDTAKLPGHDSLEVRELFRQYEEICSRYTDSECIDSMMYKRNVERVWYLKREWYSETRQIQFEGRSFPAPVCAEGYLEAHYGKDYMIPKYVDSDHEGVIWSTDRKYKYSIKSH